MNTSYVVTMLGTCTNYSPSNLKQSIPINTPYGIKEIAQTELLGFISDHIQEDDHISPRVFNPFDQTHSTKSFNCRHRLPNKKVTIINGPDVKATLVNHRVAMGVHEILRAVYNGHDEINLIAHSRGAVESILISHEIERIQDLVNQEQIETPEQFNNAYKKLTVDSSDDSKPSLIKKIIQNCLHDLIEGHLTASEIDQEEFSTFRDKLKNVKINIFAIDPVPGGEYSGPLQGLWWQDHERYLRIPKIVKQYTQILLENDHSSGFRTIVPSAEAETEFQVINLLGAHGTASGNPLKHDNTLPDSNNVDAIRDCQYITMASIIDFLEKNKIKFKACDNPSIFLGQQFDHYIKLDPKQRAIEKLAYYRRMIQNISSYLSLNTTSYIGMCEAVISRWFNFFAKPLGISLPSPSRYMYQLSHNNQFTGSPIAVNDIYAEYIVQDRQIVNQEHALLLIGLSCLYEKTRDTLSPSLKLQMLRTILEKNLQPDDIELKVKAFRLNQKHHCEQKLMDLITQVKNDFEAINDQEDCFAISQEIETILKKSVENFNPIEWFVLDKLFEVYMAIKYRQLHDAIDFHEFQNVMKIFYEAIQNRQNSLNDGTLEESRKQFVEALDKIIAGPEQKSIENKLPARHDSLFTYSNCSMFSGITAIAILPIALFAPIINVLPLLITAGILFTVSVIFFMLEKYQVETVDKQALFPHVTV